MIKKLCVLSLVLVIIFVLGGCEIKQTQTVSSDNSGQGTPQLVVSAAMSLKDALEELRDLYIKNNPEVAVIDINLGSSGSLSKQIAEGAPVDIFISASLINMDMLSDKGLIDKATRKNILENNLVLVTQKNNAAIENFYSLKEVKVKRISIGVPETAPVGNYAKEVLTSLGLWEQLQPKLVMGKDARQILTYVETGNVDAGIVYNSDAKISNNVRIVEVLPGSLHEPIIYPAAIIKDSKQKEIAQKFLDFLSKPEAKAVFGKYGFK